MLMVPNKKLYDDEREERRLTAIHRESRNPEIVSQISVGAKADWYLVRTFPGDEAKATRWLARRRFGVFRPMKQREEKRKGTPLQGWEPVFPGWLFVFCWDIRRMQRRILDCPGVVSILRDPVNKAPLPIDHKDKQGNSFIDKLRALSCVYEENAPHATYHQHSFYSALPKKKQTKKARGRLDKRNRKALKKLKKEVKRTLQWDESTWQRVNELDPHERIRLLKQSLNAPPLMVA